MRADDVVPKEIVEVSGEGLTIETPRGPGGEWSDAEGFLACVADRFKQAAIHEGNDEAAASLGKLGDAGHHELVFVGHGWPGMVCTGYGDRCAWPPERVWYYNDGKEPWRQGIKEMRGSSTDSLRLLSCNSGATDFGAKFADAMAGLVKRIVKAPRGLVWCRFADGQITVDKPSDGPTWTVAVPGTTTASVSLPLVAPPSGNTITLFIDGNPAGEKHPLAEFAIQGAHIQLTPLEEQGPLGVPVTSLKQWRQGVAGTLGSGLAAAHALRGQGAGPGDFLVDPRLISIWADLVHPIVTSNVTSALETYRLVFTIRVPGAPPPGRTVTKTFRVLNGVILEDLDTLVGKQPAERVYYRLTKRMFRYKWPPPIAPPADPRPTHRPTPP